MRVGERRGKGLSILSSHNNVVCPRNILDIDVSNIYRENLNDIGWKTYRHINYCAWILKKKGVRCYPKFPN